MNRAVQAAVGSVCEFIAENGGGGRCTHEEGRFLRHESAILPFTPRNSLPDI